MIGVQVGTPIPTSPLAAPRPTTPIGVLELVLGTEPTVSRNRGHALLEGIEATIRSTSHATILGTPWRSVRRIVAQQQNGEQDGYHSDCRHKLPLSRAREPDHMKARSVFALFQLAHEDLSFCEARAQKEVHMSRTSLDTTTTSASSGAVRQSTTFSSTRLNTGLPELDYPFRDTALTMTTFGRVCFNRQKINPSTVFAGQMGIKQVSEEIWLVTFWTIISDTSTTRPAGWSSSRILSEQKCYPCLRNNP
jgi:hypothetical protein